MAVNLLVREFKVDLEGKQMIDISGDRHIDRVFKRLGLVSKDASLTSIISCSREIYPDYPGIFDSICWEIGEAWCKPDSPKCPECWLNNLCPKIV
jgi:endonuclease III